MKNNQINPSLKKLLRQGLSDQEVVVSFMSAHSMTKAQLEETVAELLRDRIRQLKTGSTKDAAGQAVTAIEQTFDAAPIGSKRKTRGLPVMEPHNVPGLGDRIQRFGFDGVLGDLTADDLRFFATSYSTQSKQLKGASDRCLNAADELDRAKKTHIYELPAAQATRLIKNIGNLPKS